MADKKLFFAFWPSHRQREQMRDSINPALSEVEGRFVDRRNWHVTLVFIGNFPEARVPDLLSAVEIIDPGPIRLRFDTLTYWQKPRIACLNAKTVPAELELLVRSLQGALIPFGCAPETRIYRPHITVARKARPFLETTLARAIELTWSEFELMESVSVRVGVQYYPVKQ
jgi:2'-5' RNA ligase